MKRFVQYGAGNIGRGFIGALFSQAGWDVRFIDIDKTVTGALNERRAYDVEIVSAEGSERRRVEHVSGVDGSDAALVAETIASADLMATAVGVNVLPRIVDNLVAGLRLRWQRTDAPLNIILCENLLDADKFLAGLIKERLTAGEAARFDASVGLVEASIGRMVPVLPPEARAADPLFVRVERYGFLPVARAAFRGEPPQVEGLFPVAQFPFYIRRKLYLHNMGHALSAYFGRLAGDATIREAVRRPAVLLLAQRAMLESARALSRGFGQPLDGLLRHVDDLLTRFANPLLGDTVARVGADTRRKLAACDRLAGAAAFCEAQGVLPVYISAGIAAGLLFENDDPGTKAVRGMLAEYGPAYVLTTLGGLAEGSEALRYALAFYDRLKAGDPPETLLALCERFDAQNLLAARIL